jgi:hypothetical protein
MNDKNPYTPPSSNVKSQGDAAGASYKWRRAVAWLLLLFFVPQMLGLLSGLTMTHWEIYGETIQEAIDNARTVRRIAIGVAAYLLYLFFLKGVPHNRIIHVVILFFAVEFIGAVTDLFLWGMPLKEVIRWPFLLRHVLVVVMALGTAALLWRKPDSSFRPKSFPGPN